MKSQTHTSRIVSYLEELEKNGFTTKPVIFGNCTDVMPEFGRWQDVQRLFGINRGLLYLLVQDGFVKSVSLRRKGNQKGCRLFYLQSVSQYLHRLMADQGEQILKRPAVDASPSTGRDVRHTCTPESERLDQALQSSVSHHELSLGPPDKQHQSQASQSSFINEKQLLARLSISRRTLFNWRTMGKIPSVRLGGRRVLFHWPSVEAALLRYQRGGQE